MNIVCQLHHQQGDCCWWIFSVQSTPAICWVSHFTFRSKCFRSFVFTRHFFRCQYGFFGLQCQYIDYCVRSVCVHAYNCFNSAYHGRDYTCSCIRGYIGKNCDVYDWCFSSPCLNGATCINGLRVSNCKFYFLSVAQPEENLWEANITFGLHICWVSFFARSKHFHSSIGYKKMRGLQLLWPS